MSGKWIRTERGFRRLHPDELAKGLGMPKQWIDETIPSHEVDHLVGINLWEGVTEGLEPLLDIAGKTRSTHELPPPS